VSKVSAQNTPQIIYYTVACPFCPYLDVSKNMRFPVLPLNANELLLPAPSQKKAELLQLVLRILQQTNYNNKTGESHSQNVRNYQ